MMDGFRRFTFGEIETGGDDDPPKRPKIAVIGAGMAGLGAAQLLLRAGCKPVILESRDRLGGRVLTTEFDTGKMDLGAAWIHG